MFITHFYTPLVGLAMPAAGRCNDPTTAIGQESSLVLANATSRDSNN